MKQTFKLSPACGENITHVDNMILMRKAILKANYTMKEKENPQELKDGRTIWTEDNGFTHKLKDQKGNIMPITEKYYKGLVNLHRRQSKDDRKVS